jgi:hypothetical protein
MSRDEDNRNQRSWQAACFSPLRGIGVYIAPLGQINTGSNRFQMQYQGTQSRLNEFHTAAGWASGLSTAHRSLPRSSGWAARTAAKSPQLRCVKQLGGTSSCFRCKCRPQCTQRGFILPRRFGFCKKPNNADAGSCRTLPSALESGGRTWPNYSCDFDQ